MGIRTYIYIYIYIYIERERERERDREGFGGVVRVMALGGTWGLVRLAPLP